MIVNRSGWWLLEQMLARTAAVVDPGFEAPVSREQIEQAWAPAELKTVLAAHLDAAAALEEQSSYAVLRLMGRVPPLVRDARTADGTIRLVAVARSQQVVDSDPVVFVQLGKGDSVADEPTCFSTYLEDESWRAESLGYTFDRVLAWRWAHAFTLVAYPFGAEVVSLDWKYDVEQMIDILDQGLALPVGSTFQVGRILGRIEEHGAWLASRVGDNFQLYLAGERSSVRRVQEALNDASLGRHRIKPR